MVEPKLFQHVVKIEDRHIEIGLLGYNCSNMANYSTRCALAAYLNERYNVERSTASLYSCRLKMEKWVGLSHDAIQWQKSCWDFYDEVGRPFTMDRFLKWLNLLHIPRQFYLLHGENNQVR